MIRKILAALLVLVFIAACSSSLRHGKVVNDPYRPDKKNE